MNAADFSWLDRQKLLDIMKTKSPCSTPNEVNDH